MAEEETISWFAGVDWGSERHQVCLLDARGSTVGEREFPHSGEGLAELGDWLLSMASAASTVAVAIEVPHGPVVDALIDRGFVVYAINPKQLDRLRDRFSVAGAKDDRRDAYVQADGLRTDRRLFRRLQVADPRLIELRAWSRLAEELGAERVRLSNRMRHQLWRYYPQMQKLTNDPAAPWFLELWAIASTPAKAGRLRKSTVERLLKQHRIRRRSVWYFDCHGDRTCRACHREKPVSQLCQTLTTVRELALSNCAASSIEKANLVPFGAPIDTGKP